MSVADDGARASAGGQDRPSHVVRGNLDPALALLSSRSDPAALLAVWTLRRTVWPLLWIGLIGASLAGQADRIEADRFDSVSGAAATLASPLAGLILSIGVRLLSSWLGFALAYRVMLERRPIGRDTTGVEAPAVQGLVDGFHVASALRSLRWTHAVRTEAASRLGRAGRGFVLADRTLRIANPALFVLMVVVFYANAG